MDLATIERERAERKEALAAAKDEQLATDLAALNALEIERGDENVVRVPLGRFAPGRPTFVVVRPLSRVELKRYRDRCRPEDADAAAAAEECEACVLYPTGDDWTALKSAFPGIATRAGVAAVKLATGVETAEGKV